VGPKTISIRFDDLTVRVGGALKGVRPLSTPQLPEQLQFLRPPAALRSGSFCTTFVDDEVGARSRPHTARWGLMSRFKTRGSTWVVAGENLAG